jgi:hypothetical protein
MRKTVIALGLVSALAVGMASPAEARYSRNGYMWGGLAAGALIGGLLLSQPSQAAPVYVAPQPQPYYDSYHPRYYAPRYCQNAVVGYAYDGRPIIRRVCED